MSEVHDDLRATAESIAADAEELESLEQETIETRPGSTRLDQLAEATIELGEEIAAKTAQQAELVKEANAERKR